MGYIYNVLDSISIAKIIRYKIGKQNKWLLCGELKEFGSWCEASYRDDIDASIPY